MIKDWQDKTVIVTGAATGIGCAVSHELASRGAIVYVTGLSIDECQLVVDSINQKNFIAHSAKLDVNDSAEFNQVIQSVKNTHGKLDVLINNAGILYVGEFFDMEESFVEKLIQTNVTAVTMGCLHAYRLMKEQGHGLVVNVASMGGFSPTPTMAVYAATKHALLGLTNSLALEAKQFGVDIKAVCFGLIGSELFNNAEMKHGDQETVFGMLPVKPLPPEDAAKSLIDQLRGNKRIVFAPFYARITWWIYRFFPSLLNSGGLDTIKKYREIISKGS